MLRRVALISFAFAIAFVVACGHQVTPDPTNDNLAGKMVIRFRTNGAINFNLYTYAIVFNTCGEGPPYEPYPNVFATSFNNYSFSFLLGGQYGTAFPTLEQYLLTPGTTNSLNPQALIPSTSLTNLILNSNGQNTEFDLTFTREQLDNPLHVAQPCPNITPAPASASASASATATASAGASPTSSATANPSASPSAAPTATPTAAPNVQPTTVAQHFWYINFFTIDNSKGVVLDSLGQGGAQDTTYVLGIDTTTTNSNPIFKATGSVTASDPSAQIEGGEIDNYL